MILALPFNAALAQDAGQIVSVLGTAEVLREGCWQPLSAEQTLTPGDTVRTGEGSRMAIQLSNGAQIKLTPTVGWSSSRSPRRSKKASSRPPPRSCKICCGFSAARCGCAAAANRWRSKPSTPPPRCAAPSLIWRWNPAIWPA